MKADIKEIKEFVSPVVAASVIRDLFVKRSLWEVRGRNPYRNGSWYTLGASLYLDLTNELQLKDFSERATYFNHILWNHFGNFFLLLQKSLPGIFPGKVIHYLAASYPLSCYPGFHIFPPEETLTAPFGKVHMDLQWKALTKLPDFPFKPEEIEEYFAFTLPLLMPYQGGGMYLPEEEQKYCIYQERSLYLHSGMFPHMMLPLKQPVLPIDWRITLQGHGFKLKDHNDIYLYW